jgi:ligand-binding sensor domain-containing protein
VKFTLFHATDKPDWTRYLGIQSMLEDRNGTLWIGFSGGLSRFNGNSFVNAGEADLIITTRP